MIVRIWHGWTSAEDADAYQRVVDRQVVPGIIARELAGLRSVDILRRMDGEGEEVEFVTIMAFDEWRAVEEFAGPGGRTSFVPPEARAVLSRFDETSQHYELVGRHEARGEQSGAVQSPPMTDLDAQGRPEPALTGDEVATLLGFLDYQRATLAWKSRGLDTAGLNTTIGASSMTLGGLLKHMAYVEDHWFSRSLHGNDASPPWDTVDWKADPDWEWHTAAEDSPDRLVGLWQDAVARSRFLVDQALAEGGLEQVARHVPDGRTPSLRWILCHMIEEYARHNGHADLLREAVDGETGE